ncbi:MAG: hypothetical protein JJE23_06145 [Thermoleophilia bacterium]|nr:hypothetical protein [Thermoleophilia bacterium]
MLTHEGYGHVSFDNPSACVERARVGYLVELITPRRAPSQRRTSNLDPGFG